jgi:hypothetical protein
MLSVEPSWSFTDEEKRGGPRYSNASSMKSHINNTVYSGGKFSQKIESAELSGLTPGISSCSVESVS